MSVAITLSFMGHWLASGFAGRAAVVIVGACLWQALTDRFTPTADDDDGDDGGGGPRKRPDPPAPPQPAGGPPDDGATEWTDVDRARANWEREREPVRA